ncbi:OprD family porin [Pseudomonas aeruginosa]|uniref:OprD family porin n=1 Tax=Pseudomonas aeruginosa TaxID=287 RepID=UPI001EC7A65B|nr:OprD family porin [Pseudomonas aeruginosa]MBX6555980.1 OprD family porin [Pseudomonas aeruginosa]MBX6881719.1 OprD family porin [Pseudomonas aeruginosa]MBX6932401.1 OprD family porin [Pseudomonas aeruginosa]MCZ9866524.1 OprD family porin [Pseudomonas aeruginosa]MCZ9906144.1 OprD family porin [Pseudomonas aeruginosa]
MTRSAPNLLKSASLAPVLLAGLPSLAGAEGFIEDASVSLGLRNLYFNRDFRQPGAAQSKQEEWAQGFLLQAKSGYTQGTLGLGVELLGQLGLKLDSSLDRAGSGLLPRHADGRAADDYARLGVAPKLKLSNTELKLGELLPELPILLRNDGRLLPQTFQGGMLTSREIAGLTLHGGQMRSLSQRNSSDHQDLSVDGRGGAFSDRFDYLGAEYRFNAERSQVGLWQARLQDIYRQDYYSLSHKQSFGGWRLGASVGLFDTRDEGAAKLGDLENRALTGFFSATRGGHSLGAGYQRMYGDDGMLYIAGTSTPLVNDIQVRNFTSAGERSWQLRYDYDFVALGIPGLTAMARYASGAHARTKAMDDGRAWERDVDVAYVIQSGPLKNLGLRWRNAMLRSNHAADVDENRLILSYSLPLL